MNSKMTRALIGLGMVLAVALVGGCIVSDQLTTVTIHPDGSADVMRIHANVHSTETGAKGQEEIASYVREFDARTDSDQARIVEAGGVIEESRWMRSSVPMSNLVLARIPNAVALERAFTYKNEKGEPVVKAKFTTSGDRRRFSLWVHVNADEPVTNAPEESVGELRNSQANGLSETRFCVTQGRILEARGFTIASDKQSALLEPNRVLELLKRQPELELFLEWEVIP